MLDKQSKNTIKAVLAVLLLTVVGEGVFGWGVYWPFLLILSNWSGIYWLGLITGILVSVFSGVSIGIPSLFIVVVVAGLSLVMNGRGNVGVTLVFVSILVGFVFDKTMGFGWSVWEGIIVGLFSWIAMSFFDKSETIRINY